MAIAVKRFPKVQVVNYQSYRSEIKSGDLLLCSGSKAFSRIIQAGTKSVWSHVGFVMRLDAIDRVMVLESVETVGVRTVPLRSYLTDYDSKGGSYPGGLVIARHKDFAAKVDKIKLNKLGKFAVDLFGYPYDTEEIARIAARIAASYIPFTNKDKKAFRRNREYICSEYVWECYKAVGIDIPYDPEGFVAPADFAKVQEVDLQAVLKAKQ